MTPRFLKFIPFIFKWEGEFDNDPDDPGGMTWFGIDKRSHPDDPIWTFAPKRTVPEFAAKAKARAQEIYFEEYWQRNRCEDLPEEVGEVVMNIAVNAGSGRAGKWLQQAVNEFLREPLVVDGAIGPKTVASANQVPAALVARALLDRTEIHYRSIARGRLAKFLKGWLNRNNDLRKWVVNN